MAEIGYSECVKIVLKLTMQKAQKNLKKLKKTIDIIKIIRYNKDNN